MLSWRSERKVKCCAPLAVKTPVIVATSASAAISNESPVIHGPSASRLIASSVCGGVEETVCSSWPASIALIGCAPSPDSKLRRRSFARRQRASDGLRPLLDRFPVAEVAFGSANAFDDHALHEGKLAMVERAEEDTRISRRDALLELDELLRLRLSVFDLDAERSAGEEPDRTGCQRGLVAVDKFPGLFEPG